jgi:hypothetical protein
MAQLAWKASKLGKLLMSALATMAMVAAMITLSMFELLAMMTILEIFSYN